MNTNNPFDALNIDKSKFSVKVWDLSAYDADRNEGRIRILAVVPKRPAPLNDIRVAVSWCSPVDLKRFTRKRSNDILVGRWLKAFGGEDPMGDVYNNVGILSVDSLDDFPVKVFQVVVVPLWACYIDRHLRPIT